MDCSAVEELVVPYLRGTLKCDEAATLEKHIAGCRECSRSVAEEMVADLAHAVPQKNPPQSVKDRLFVKVRSLSPSKSVFAQAGKSGA